MLGWSILDLARVSGVSVLTVRRLELGQGCGRSPDQAERIRRVLQREGIGFLPDDGGGPGVRLCRRTLPPCLTDLHRPVSGRGSL